MTFTNGSNTKGEAASPGASGPVVVKIGGSTLDDLRTMGSLWGALVELARRAAGGVVLVHGGGKAVDAILAKLGMPVVRRDGLRLTPPDQIEVIAGVLAGTINKKIVGALRRAGANAVGLCLGDGEMVRCERIERAADGTPLDIGCVGRVSGGEARIVRLLVQSGYLPVISSIGLDSHGGLLNVNADEAAAGVARATGATRLVLVTDVAGVRDGSGRVRERLTLREINAMIGSGEITGGMIPKVRAAIDAAEASGAPVVITTPADPGNLIRLALGGHGAGTEVVRDE
jgi:acetylglutamate kinase